MIEHYMCVGCGMTHAQASALVDALRQMMPLASGSDASHVVPLFDRHDAEAMARVPYVILRQADWDRIRALIAEGAMR